MTIPPVDRLEAIATDGVSHGFFSRHGGVSTGMFDSLNAGFGSSDDHNAVATNRARCAAALGLPDQPIMTAHQIHSADVEVVTSPFTGPPPQADAMVSKAPGLILGVLAADCMPWLFVDSDARVVGAAHAGWRGALAGVLENTIEAMVALGASRTNICAALGPCLRQRNFEVGLDLVETFTGRYPESAAFFAPGKSAEKRQFDLASFAKGRLASVGISYISDVEKCTLAAPEDYFSYRASQRAGENDYGRNLSAIALL